MIFFTRELQDGLQHNSGRERRATNEWRRAEELYSRYLELISPRLPATVRQLCREGLHDGIIRRVSHRSGELVLVLDMSGALGLFRGRSVRLTFRGVAGRMRTSHLADQWWLYQEAHLRPRGRFELHVLFDTEELAIEADELVIERLR